MIDPRCGGYEYTVSFVTEANFRRVGEVAAALQVSLWGNDSGAGPAASFSNRSIKKREDGRWEVALERPDCESDFHNCGGEAQGYGHDGGGYGHDGSDEQAITQLELEIKEGLEECQGSALIRDMRVEQRHKIVGAA